MRISDWSSDVCSSDLGEAVVAQHLADQADPKSGAGFDVHTQAASIIVDALGMVPGLEVAHIAFGKGAPAGEPRLDDIAGDRTRDGRKQVVGIEIADAGLGLHGEMTCRAFGDAIKRK